MLTNEGPLRHRWADSKRTMPLMARKRGELLAPTLDPSRLVGGPTVAMEFPNCGFARSATG